MCAPQLDLSCFKYPLTTCLLTAILLSTVQESFHQWWHFYWMVLLYSFHTQGGKQHLRTWNNNNWNTKLTFNILTYRPLKCCSPKSLNRWAISLLSVGTERGKTTKHIKILMKTPNYSATFHTSFHKLKLLVYFKTLASHLSKKRKQTTKLPESFLLHLNICPVTKNSTLKLVKCS